MSYTVLLLAVLGALALARPHLAGWFKTSARKRTIIRAPQQLLFSRPTICDALPPLEASTSGATPPAYQVSEDDWRQVEFIAPTDVAGVARELTKLALFMQKERVGPGWKSVYIRKNQPKPLRSLHIPLAALQGALSGATLRPLAIATAVTHRLVVGGFAVDLAPNVVLYGEAPDGVVASLSIASQVAAERSLVAPTLATICAGFGIRLVDWCRAAWVEFGPST